MGGRSLQEIARILLVRVRRLGHVHERGGQREVGGRIRPLDTTIRHVVLGGHVIEASLHQPVHASRSLVEHVVEHQQLAGVPFFDLDHRHAPGQVLVRQIIAGLGGRLTGHDHLHIRQHRGQPVLQRALELPGEVAGLDLRPGSRHQPDFLADSDVRIREGLGH